LTGQPTGYLQDVAIKFLAVVDASKRPFGWNISYWWTDAMGAAFDPATKLYIHILMAKGNFNLCTMKKSAK
jgi:hypothetical protein